MVVYQWVQSLIQQYAIIRTDLKRYYTVGARQLAIYPYVQYVINHRTSLLTIGSLVPLFMTASVKRVAGSTQISDSEFSSCLMC